MLLRCDDVSFTKGSEKCKWRGDFSKPCNIWHGLIPTGQSSNKEIYVYTHDMLGASCVWKQIVFDEFMNEILSCIHMISLIYII